jgi:hypothetical protein
MPTSQDRILITALGFGASWNGDAVSTPWSVYITPNGLPILDGGEYPSECNSSQLVLSDLRMEHALILSDRLAAILTELGHVCVTEAIGDA